jgi:hypothetical protein
MPRNHRTTEKTFQELNMIRISVGDNWVVTSDCYQFILNKKKTVLSGDKKGQGYLEVVGYYAKIEQLINGLIHFEIRLSNVNEIAALSKVINQVAQSCQKYFLQAEKKSN